eukprot:TRINITY_DN15631_c0_g1_i1.p1 TRINITY_DN15631_c0_g1~~TRINITY_DN15631_c0_g1_i1.p1  ORF type:complete len:657 (+),score=165.77 TRINITY_DN15631_c0_g1_i1:220-2190(+)
MLSSWKCGRCGSVFNDAAVSCSLCGKYRGGEAETPAPIAADPLDDSASEGGPVEAGGVAADAQRAVEVSALVAAAAADLSADGTWVCEGCGQVEAFPNVECTGCGCEMPEPARVKAPVPEEEDDWVVVEGVSSAEDDSGAEPPAPRRDVAGLVAAAMNETATVELEGVLGGREILSTDAEASMAEPVEDEAPDTLFLCNLCGSAVAARLMADHLRGHLNLVQLEEAELLAAARDDLIRITGEEVDEATYMELLKDWKVLPDQAGLACDAPRVHAEDEERRAAQLRAQWSARATSAAATMAQQEAHKTRRAQAQQKRERKQRRGKEPPAHQLRHAEMEAARKQRHVDTEVEALLRLAGGEAPASSTPSPEEGGAGSGAEDSCATPDPGGVAALVDRLQGFYAAKALQEQEIKGYLADIADERARDEAREKRLRQAPPRAGHTTQSIPGDPTVTRIGYEYDPASYASPHKIMVMHGPASRVREMFTLARMQSSQQLTDVPRDSEEYARVGMHFIHTLVGNVDGPRRVRVRSLRRVCIPGAWHAYEKARLDRPENLMFHGCRSSDNEKSILANGFRVDKCVSGGARFGTWLAFNAAYSDGGFVFRTRDGAARIFVCFAHRKSVRLVNPTMMVVGQDCVYPAYLLEYERVTLHIPRGSPA